MGGRLESRHETLLASLPSDTHCLPCLNAHSRTVLYFHANLIGSEASPGARWTGAIHGVLTIFKNHRKNYTKVCMRGSLPPQKGIFSTRVLPGIYVSQHISVQIYTSPQIKIPIVPAFGDCWQLQLKRLP